MVFLKKYWFCWPWYSVLVEILMLILKRFVPKTVEFNFQLTSIFRAMSIRNSEQAIQKKHLFLFVKQERVECGIRSEISLLRSRFLGCHAMLWEELRDIPKNGCGGD